MWRESCNNKKRNKLATASRFLHSHIARTCDIFADCVYHAYKHTCNANRTHSHRTTSLSRACVCGRARARVCVCLCWCLCVLQVVYYTLFHVNFICTILYFIICPVFCFSLSSPLSLALSPICCVALPFFPPAAAIVMPCVRFV